MRVLRDWDRLIGVALCGALLVVPARAADVAERVPDDAMVAIEWSRLAENNALFEVGRAILSSPLLANEHDRDIIQMRALFDFVEIAGRHDGIVAITPPGVDGSSEPQLYCAVNAGADAAKLMEQIKKTLTSEEPSETPESVTIGALTFQRYGNRPDAAHVAMQKDLVLLTWGAHAAEVIAAPEKLKSLGKLPEFVQAHQKVKAEGAWRASLFVNIEAGLALVKGQGGGGHSDAERILEALGLNQFKSFLLQLDSNSFGNRMTWYVHGPTKPEGLAKLWHQKPLTDGDVALIPREPYWATATRLDLAELYQEAMTVGEKIDPQVPVAVNGAMAMVQRMLGFSPTENLLPAFGDTWVMYDAPDHAGLLLTGIVLVNNVRDEAGLQGMLQRTIDYFAPLAKENDVTLVRKEMKHGGHTIHYLLVGGLPVPIAPAWAFVNKQWVFALSPQTVATALVQIDPATRKQSLLENADYKAGRALLPRELTAVHYSDARNGYKTFYPLMLLLKTAAASASAGGAQPFDLGAVPTYPEKLAGLHNMISGTSVDSEGILSTSVGVTPGAMLLGGSMDVSTVAMMSSILLPSLARAREMAKRAVCAANIRGVGQGCWIYAQDHQNRFPDSLQLLVDGGMLTPNMLVCPSSDVREADVQAFLKGQGSIGWTYIPGYRSAKGSPQDVLMFESLEHHNGEGGNVLFFDSHVEFMRPEALKAAVVATYKRLGREAEIPPEFSD